MSKFHQKPGDVLDKRSGPAKINFRVLLGRKARLSKQHFINSSPMAHPPLRLFAGQRVDNTQIRIAARHHIEFLSIDDVFQTSLDEYSNKAGARTLRLAR